MVERTRVILGLNSGTSADGVDAAACEIRGRGLAMRVRLIGHLHRAYPRRLRDRILAAMAPAQTRTAEVCRLNVEIGQAFADGAAVAMRRFGLRRVDAVGAHGQTVCHLPPGSRLDQAAACPRRGRASRQVSATLQIGDPAVIAARLRVPVVGHFREADMAVGGQGAPLVPWTDYVLFGDQRRGRVIQNIGGIANLTWLPAGGGPDDVIAFDTGPGNMVIDGLVRRFTHGRMAFDRGGRRAARGRVNNGLLKRLLRHPFLRRRPPKSCGREEFGAAWLEELLRADEGVGTTAGARPLVRESLLAPQPAGARIPSRTAEHETLSAADISTFSILHSQLPDAGARIPSRTLDDWIATATALTAATIADAYSRFLRSLRGAPAMPDEVIVCGGGASNPTLLHMLAERLHGEFGRAAERINVTTMDGHGIPSQAKEALSFAMLAAACLDGVPANLPNVTGAKRRVVLGQICNMESRP